MRGGQCRCSGVRGGARPLIRRTLVVQEARREPSQSARVPVARRSVHFAIPGRRPTPSMSYVENPVVALTASAIALRLIAVLVIVLTNAFFVAAELSLVSARRLRIDALAARGDRSTKLVQETANDIPRYLSAVQLGVTLASLALGWAGETTVASLIAALFERLGLGSAAVISHAAATVIVAFVTITFLHIVIGELVPKSIAYANLTLPTNREV